jgi:hypothetical protein
MREKTAPKTKSKSQNQRQRQRQKVALRSPIFKKQKRKIFARSKFLENLRICKTSKLFQLSKIIL